VFKPSEVNHSIDPAREGLVQRARIGDRPCHNRDAIRDHISATGAEVVEDNYVMPSVNECMHGVTTDIPGSPGDAEFHSGEPTGAPPTRARRSLPQ